MTTIEILEKLVGLFSQGGKGVFSPEMTAKLLADLPPEAVAGPKKDAQGNILKSWDAEYTGYTAAYVLMTGLERLGPAGWVSVPVYGEPWDDYISNGAMRDKTPDAVGVNVELVTYFPGLHTARITSGTGKGKTMADARKGACTTALKRALAEVGIGWRAYTGEELKTDPADLNGNGPQPPAPVKQERRPAPSSKPADPPPAPRGTATPGASAARPPAASAAPSGPAKASDLQVGKIRHELEDAGIAIEDWEGLEGPLGSLTKAKASELIGKLIARSHPLQQQGAPSDDPYGGA